MEEDIFRMHEAGATYSLLERRFPLFTRAEIIQLIHTRFDLADDELNLVDGSIIRVYQRNIGRIEDLIDGAKEGKDPEAFVLGIQLQNRTLMALASFRETQAKIRLSRKTGDLLDNTDPDTINVTISFQKRIEDKLNSEIPPPYQQLWVNELRRLTDSGAPREKIEEFIEAEWQVIQPTLQLSAPKSIQDTTEEEIEEE